MEFSQAQSAQKQKFTKSPGRAPMAVKAMYCCNSQLELDGKVIYGRSVHIQGIRPMLFWGFSGTQAGTSTEGTTMDRCPLDRPHKGVVTTS